MDWTPVVKMAEVNPDVLEVRGVPEVPDSDVLEVW